MNTIAELRVLFFSSMLLWGIFFSPLQASVAPTGDQAAATVDGSVVSGKQLEDGFFTKQQVVSAGNQEPRSDRVVTSGGEEQADLRGYIKLISKPGRENRKEGWWGTVVVEGTGAGADAIDRASVDIGRDTQVLNAGAKGLESGTADDLRVGDLVEVFFTGPVAYSYPVLAKGRKIVILQAAP